MEHGAWSKGLQVLEKKGVKNDLTTTALTGIEHCLGFHPFRWMLYKMLSRQATNLSWQCRSAKEATSVVIEDSG
jgi:hypothetical protein